MLTVATDKNSATRPGAHWRIIRDLRSRWTPALLTPDPDEGALGARGSAGVHVWLATAGHIPVGRERLAEAVRRSPGPRQGWRASPHQLRVFDDPNRDDRGWVLSVAHWAVVRPDRLASRFETETRRGARR